MQGHAYLINNTSAWPSNHSPMSHSLHEYHIPLMQFYLNQDLDMSVYVDVKCHFLLQSALKWIKMQHDFRSPSSTSHAKPYGYRELWEMKDLLSWFIQIEESLGSRSKVSCKLCDRGRGPRVVPKWWTIIKLLALAILIQPTLRFTSYGKNTFCLSPGWIFEVDPQIQLGTSRKISWVLRPSGWSLHHYMKEPIANPNQETIKSYSCIYLPYSNKFVSTIWEWLEEVNTSVNICEWSDISSQITQLSTLNGR